MNARPFLTLRHCLIAQLDTSACLELPHDTLTKVDLIRDLVLWVTTVKKVHRILRRALLQHGLIRSELSVKTTVCPAHQDTCVQELEISSLIQTAQPEPIATMVSPLKDAESQAVVRACIARSAHSSS